MYASWAESLAKQLLADVLPERWVHSRAVGLKARELRDLVGEHADVLEAAAFLHDIGYAPSLKVTGFHSLDGARYLRAAAHAPALLCMLVANHTAALIEASERGLEEVLADEFPIGPWPETDLVAALTYCDLSVGPTGGPTTADERISEILSRYGPEDLVHKAIERASPVLKEQYGRWEAARRSLTPDDQQP